MTFTIYGTPQGKARPRFARGIAYTPQKTVEYEKLIRKAFKDAGGCYFKETAFIVEMFSYAPIPQSASKKAKADMLARKLFPSKRPDIDNIEKVVYDALNKVAYKDDCMIVAVVKSKLYGTTPRIDVRIAPVQGNDYVLDFVLGEALRITPTKVRKTD